MTVKLDGDIIMGEIVADKRYCASAGSEEELRSVCSCTCLTCHPGFLTRSKRSTHGRDSYSTSPPPVYSDYYQSPPKSRPESVHDIRSCEFDDFSLLATISGRLGNGDFRNRNVDWKSRRLDTSILSTWLLAKQRNPVSSLWFQVSKIVAFTIILYPQLHHKHLVNINYILGKFQIVAPKSSASSIFRCDSISRIWVWV